MTVRRLAADQPASFEFTPENRAWAEAQIAKYPPGRQASAVIPLLWKAQAQNDYWLPRAAIEKVANETLPQGIGYEWTELAYQEKLTGNTATYIFILAVVFVFLALAAQYESWGMPFAIVLIVPMSVLSALMASQAPSALGASLPAFKSRPTG